MQICLNILDPSGQPTGDNFIFTEHACFIFGRDQHAHYRITNDPAVSRHHFLLEIIPPEICIKDLGSTNGIVINGQRYGGKNGLRNADGSAIVVSLTHRDRIKVGRTLIEVEVILPKTQPAFPTADLSATAATIRLDSPEQKTVSSETEQITQKVAAPKSKKTSLKNGFWQAVNSRANEDISNIELPDYKLSKLLGKGSMGAVYLAQRCSDNHPAAVKLMQPGNGRVNSDNIIMFRREIAINRTLSHPNVVAFYQSGEIDGYLYLAMEYLPGKCLAGFIKKNGTIPWSTALAWIRQIAAGLSSAHQLNLVHRDIKPSNILLDNKEQPKALKLADFGLAKSMLAAGLSGFTLTGMGAGTASCMPPEQISGFRQANKSADIFALGATLYEMLTGRSPYNFSSDKDITTVILNYDLTRLSDLRPDLPLQLTLFVDHCLNYSATDRFADASEFLDNLSEI